MENTRYVKLQKIILPGCKSKISQKAKEQLTRSYTEIEEHIDRGIYCGVVFNSKSEKKFGCLAVLPLKERNEGELIWDDYLYGIESFKPGKIVKEYQLLDRPEKFVYFRVSKQKEERPDVRLRKRVLKLSGFSIDELYSHLNDQYKSTYRFLSFLLLDKLYPGNSPKANKWRYAFLKSKSENLRLSLLEEILLKKTLSNYNLKGINKDINIRREQKR